MPLHFPPSDGSGSGGGGSENPGPFNAIVAIGGLVTEGSEVIIDRQGTGSLYLVADSALSITVNTGGQLATLQLSALSADTIDLASLTTVTLAYLKVNNPSTFAVPIAGATSTVQIESTALTTVDVSACGSASVMALGACTALTSLTLPASLNWVSFDATNCDLNLATVNSVLAKMDANGLANQWINIAGNNSAPSHDIPAVAATGSVTILADYTSFATGNWLKPTFKSTERYFWFNLDGGQSDPSPGGIGVEINVTTGMTDIDIANALASAMDANGYSGVSTSGTTTVSYTLDEAGLGVNWGQPGSASVSFGVETDGSDSYNSNIASIVARGGTVFHN